MRKILLAFALASFMFTAYAANNTNGNERKMTRKELREKRKAEEAKLDSMSYKLAVLAINANSWVLKATSITVTGGPNVFVQPNVNFIQVVGNTMTLQTSTGFGGGPNNMGGITASGTISRESRETDKNGGLEYTFRVNGTTINGTVMVDLPSEQSVATAFINFDSGTSITMQGVVRPYSNTEVYEGTPIY